MADQRIQYTEKMVGAGHPTKADTLNRLMLVEHLADGSHKYSNAIDARIYGAVGDGATDDTTAIQNALNAVPSTGGRVYLPEGIYKVSSTLTLSKYIEFFGDGANATIISTASTTGSIINVDAGGCYLHDFQVTASVTRTSGANINLTTNGSSSTIERFMLYNYFIGIDVAASCCVRILNGQCRYGVSGTWTAGILISAGTDHYIDHVTMDNVVGTQCESGIRVMSVDTLVITNCDIIHHGTALNVIPSTGYVVSSLWASNSFFDNNNMRGLTLGGTGTIIRCRFADCWFASNTQQGILISCTGTIAGIDISNPHIFLNGNNGMQVGVDCGFKVAGGFVGGNTNAGIAIAANVGNFSIVGTSSGNCAGLSGNTTYGIQVFPGTSNNYIISLCDVRGNTSGGIADSGTGVNKIVNYNMS